MNKINFLQKKYIIPLLALPFVIFIAYMINQFKPAETNSNLVEVEELNSQLQDPVSTPNNQNNADAGKLTALKQRLKREGDFTSIQNVEAEVVEDEMIKNSTSLYTTEEMRQIDSINQVNAIKADELRQTVEKYRSKDYTASTPSETEVTVQNVQLPQQQSGENELTPEEIQQKKIEKQIQLLDSITNAKSTAAGKAARKDIETTTTQVIEHPEQPINHHEEQPIQVKRSKEVNNNYFNTVGNLNYNLGISAILDESLKVEQGSRVRIRLLEEITLGEYRLQAGEYLYGTVTGFNAQRVIITITSIMVDGRPQKVNLSVYDIDGMEGFYVPASAFREYAKEAASKTANQNITIESGSNDVRQFSYKMLQDLYQSSTQAISKNIRQNKARLKYATQIFLVNKDEQ